MGEAYYCDRCGKLLDDTKVNKKDIEIHGAWSEIYICILCDNCVPELESFINGEDLAKGK